MKRSLRREYRAARRALGSSQRDALSERIAEHVLAQELWHRARVIAAFVGTGSEVDTRRLLEAAGDRLVLPRVDAPGQPLAFCRAMPEELVVGAHGILAPAPGVLRVDPALVDLVLVPALAIDDRGNRLGQGGGFYDRTLRGMVNAHRVAVVFEVQRTHQLAVEAHDLPVHAVVTERGWASITP
ncbi:MAG: 5-formyltetrahydrofolate cyclo-ligase [Proteobacteria bacterium]|nr:5-formyltetrahydrofolate cyclo-ligase [Pseudomonadota bacterium]